MAYDNINVDKAKIALNNCLGEISYDKSKKIMVGIKDNNVWNTSARDVLYDALDKVVNTKYKKLRQEITKYLNVILKVEKYKANEVNKMNAENSVNYKQNLIIKEEEKKKNYEKDAAKYAIEIAQVNKNIEDYKKDIENLNSNIETYKSNMKDLDIEIKTVMED